MNANQFHLSQKSVFFHSRQWNAIVIAGANLLVNEFVSIIFSVHLHFYTSNNRLFDLFVFFFFLSAVPGVRDWHHINGHGNRKKKYEKKTPQPFIALWNRLAFHFIYFMDTWISWEPCYYQISHKSFDFKSVESCVRCAYFHRDRKMRLCNLMSPKQNYNTKRWSFIWISQLFMCIFSSVKEDKCC